MLPMGTIVTACMIIALLFTSRLPLLKHMHTLPRALRRAVSLLVFAIGGWNVFWYASRNINEFWGKMALISGLLMLISACYILDAHRLPKWLNRIRPLILLILLCFAILYGTTIYQL